MRKRLLVVSTLALSVSAQAAEPSTPPVNTQAPAAPQKGGAK